MPKVLKSAVAPAPLATTPPDQLLVKLHKRFVGSLFM